MINNGLPLVNVRFQACSPLADSPVLAGRRPKRPPVGTAVLDLGLFGHLQRVIHLDPKVPHGTLKLCVPE